MIYTLTANPAIDMNITCTGLEPNRVTRTRDAVYTPNGKGLNVSFTLQRRGIDSTILGFFAGFTGRFIEEGAREQGCDVKPVWVDGITRVNVFLSDAGTGNEYTLPNAGAPVTHESQLEMYELIESLDDMECLVISGSMPPGTDDDFLEQVISRVKAKGAEFVLDISSPKLADLAAEGPLLIKPNDDELRAIFGLDVSDDESVAAAMRELSARGVKNVLLTLGGAGGYFWNGEHLWSADPVKVKVLQTACAGDATLGSFLGVWHGRRAEADQDAVVTEALTLAMATGANVVECPGLGDFAHVEEYMSRVTVRKVL